MVEFEADKTVMSNLLFNLLSDLAAETWYKAASRWRDMNHTPVEFASLATPAGTCSQKKFIRNYAPVRRGALERELEHA